MNSKPIWFLVADRSGALLFERERPGARPRLLERYDHPEGRRRDQDIDSDRPGRSFSRSSTVRHALGKSVSPAEHASEMFAHRLAKHLDEAVHEGRCGEVVLIAEPAFAGELRATLTEKTARIAAVIPKALVHLPEHELVAQLHRLEPSDWGAPSADLERGGHR